MKKIVAIHCSPRSTRNTAAPVSEAAAAVITYAFAVLQAESLFSGHNPRNVKSAKVLKKLGFFM